MVAPACLVLPPHTTTLEPMTEMLVRVYPYAVCVRVPEPIGGVAAARVGAVRSYATELARLTDMG